MSLEGRPVRREIAHGMEHVVFDSVLFKDVVLKVSRQCNLLSMMGRNPAGVLRRELINQQRLVEGTTVVIPTTRIFDRGVKGYVVAQEHICEDGSVVDIQGYLEGQGLDTLVDEYLHEPRNFISFRGRVYLIDPTKGTVGRILEDLHIMKLTSYRRVRRKLSGIIRAIGL